jgi:hypothetical protein
VTFVVVGHRSSTARLHRQTRLGAVERLDLALLVDREDDRMGGRIGRAEAVGVACVAVNQQIAKWFPVACFVLASGIFRPVPKFALCVGNRTATSAVSGRCSCSPCRPLSLGGDHGHV